MDDMIFDVVAGKVEEFVAPLGFETKENGCFKKENIAFRVAYNSNSKTFNLILEETEGEEKTESTVSSWLFTEEHRRKDAEVIGEDFADCIRAKLGIAKSVNVADVSAVSLPRASKDAAPNIEQFTQRFLAVYPQYKDDYKENVAKYGAFLPVEFYRTRGAEKMKEIAAEGNKKHITKMMEMLNEFYCQGDRQVGDTIMTLFFGGAFYDNKELFDSTLQYMEDYPFLKSAAVEMVKVASKNKKLRALFN